MNSLRRAYRHDVLQTLLLWGGFWLAWSILVGLYGRQIAMHPDESTFLLMARGWIEGHVPYRDLADNKPPLLYLQLFPLVAWGTTSVLWLRIAVAGIWTMGLALFALLLRRQIGISGWVSVLVALCVGLFFLRADHLGITYYSESFVWLWMVGFFLAYFAPPGSRWRPWVMGVLFACAVLTNQHAVLLAAPLLAVWFEEAGKRHFLHSCLAALVVVLPVLAYFGWKGAWPALLDSLYFEPYADFSTTGMGFGWVYLALFALSIRLAAGRERLIKLFGAWLLPGLIIYLADGSTYASFVLNRKLIYFAPALAAMMAILWQDWLPNRWKVTWGRRSVLLLVVGLGWFAVGSLQTSAERGKLPGGGYLALEEQERVSDYILSSVGERALLLFPRAIWPYYATDRDPPLRLFHYYDKHLAAFAEDPELFAAWQKELDESQIEVVVYNEQDPQLAGIRVVQDYLEDNYRLERRMGRLLVYVREMPPLEPSSG